jgi:TRAP transporter TAXI family solute receptor
MSDLIDRYIGREMVLLAIAIIGMAVAAAFYLTQATVLTIAVAPKDGTEPELIQAYADALAASKQNIRFKILSFDEVTDSAKALQDGRADLAVVRPDVSLPANGLTLAILRDQAMLVVAPAASGIKTLPALSGKRLGIAAHKDADVELLKNILSYYGMTLTTEGTAAAVPSHHVSLVAVNETEVATAFHDKRIDVFISIIALSAPKALSLVDAIKSVSRDGKIVFASVEDDAAIMERFPRLESVTIPGGLFGGRPKLPDDDVKTIGASYRLVARASLSRSTAADVTQHIFEMRTAASRITDAAEYIKAPSYETTVAATSMRVPIHPGALDYYERDQHSFIDRYGDTLYLLAALIGGLGSAAAWLRERLIRARRERIDEVTDRLLEIIAEVRTTQDPATLRAFLVEIDELAVDVVRYVRDREPDDRTIAAVSIAIRTARSAVADHMAYPQTAAE